MQRIPLLGKNPIVRSLEALLLFLGVCACIFISMHMRNSALAVNKVSLLGTGFSLNCSDGNNTITCPANYYPTTFKTDRDISSTPSTCPDYFRWIHEDLRPWRDVGITKEMVERANRTANFRLVILNGRAYVETYEKGFQTRDTLTLWGILQLLRRYPGKVPDLDLMFDCVDWPVIRSDDYLRPEEIAPPPLFRFCGDDDTLDIVFPDWSFWGWPEVNIKPWEELSRELKEANKEKSWKDREPYAYWKGTPKVAEKRKELIKCNVSEGYDWHARIYKQDWDDETRRGFKQSSDVTKQCNHRYKIYIEGSAWSVSQKYILACDSVTLIVKPHYYDFFSRGLMPLQHYWPIREEEKCRSISFAVEWGNIHDRKAQSIGKKGSKFIEEELKMEYVYDYMFHLFNEYAKLLKYKPSIPPQAVELCSETMACPAEGLNRKFMIESMATGPADTRPCTMPPPFDRPSLDLFLQRKEFSLHKVERWEWKYWESKSMKLQK